MRVSDKKIAFPSFMVIALIHELEGLVFARL